MTTIKVIVKQLGKKYPLSEKQIVLPKLPNPFTLRDLITHLVTQQVEQLLEKPLHDHLNGTDAGIIPNLDDYQLLLTATGKVGFNVRYRQDNIDLAEAQATAVLAFEDGLFAVFKDAETVESLDTQLDCSLSTQFTFIRLTFLSGRLW